MGRPNRPASLKKGKSETKEQLEERAALEKQLQGDDDEVKIPPEEFSDEEKSYYLWLVEEIELVGLITNLDKPLLEQTATCLSAIKECDRVLRKDGIFVDSIDRYGNIEVKEHQANKTKQSYMGKYAQLCNQLGLSPSARAALASKKVDIKKQEEDPVLKALRGEDDEDEGE